MAEITVAPAEIHVYHHVLHEGGTEQAAGPHWTDEAISFLDSIDPQQLQQAALNMEEWGEERSHTELVLHLIKEAFRGAQPQRTS